MQLARTTSLALILLAATACARLGADVVDVIRFADTVTTQQGGQFRPYGALPDKLQDRLDVLGTPPAGAWRLEALAEAPSSGFGGFVPLFDTTRRNGKPNPLDLSATPVLEARLLGALAERKVNVELCADPSGEGKCLALDTLAAGQLDAQAWKTFHFKPPGGADLSKIAAIRFAFDGAGAGWFAIADLRFVEDAAHEPRPLVAPEAPAPVRQALWVWTTDEILSDPARVERLLAFCKAQQLTDLFWQIPHTKPSSGKIEHVQVEAQRAFNAQARALGLTVHALDGNPKWVLKENHQTVFDIVAAVERFNADSPPEARYAAVHMDNEPYVLADWKKGGAIRQKIIDDYYALNVALQKQVHAAGMKYGVDIPFWWDQFGPQGEPVFAVKTEAGEKALLEALFPLVDNAGIMSYRIRALGANGVVDCCRTEFALGAKLGVEVFASVELGTGEKVEPGITFGVYPIEYFLTQRETLLRVLPRQQGCVGLAIHHYDPFVAMMEKRP
jgi:hypothetical protein